MPVPSYFFDAPKGTCSFRLLKTKIGTSFVSQEVPDHLERMLHYRGGSRDDSGWHGGRGGGGGGNKRPCKNFARDGSCKFGDRCHFSHGTVNQQQHVLCHLIAVPQQEENENHNDLTSYPAEDGGGGAYHNVCINSTGFVASIQHFLTEACKYDAQISMHVAFGRVGLMVPLGMLQGGGGGEF